MLKDKKIIFSLLITSLFLTSLLVLVLKLSKNSKPKSLKKTVKTQKSNVLKSVKVSLKKAKRQGAIILSISNIPADTESIEYELTYQTQDKGLQGVIGVIDKLEGSAYRKEIFLGTCSSGTCIRHKVVGKIDLLLKFKGSYGEVVFEQEFKI